eukprot:s2002_g5.t1
MKRGFLLQRSASSTSASTRGDGDRGHPVKPSNPTVEVGVEGDECRKVVNNEGSNLKVTTVGDINDPDDFFMTKVTSCTDGGSFNVRIENGKMICYQVEERGPEVEKSRDSQEQPGNFDVLDVGQAIFID